MTSPRECWDGGGRGCRADGVVDGPSPAAEGGSPVRQGGSRYGVREAGHWKTSGTSDGYKSKRWGGVMREGSVPVYSSGAYIAPITGLIFHPEAVRTSGFNTLCLFYPGRTPPPPSPESSPFTRGVCGFLVTTLAVALFTCTRTEPLIVPLNHLGLYRRPPPPREPHLDLPALHNGSVQLFSGPVSLGRVLEGHEPETLQVRGVERFP